MPKKLLNSDFQEQMEMMYKTIYYTIKTGHKVYICIDDNFDSSLHGMVNDIIGKVKLCYPITSGLHMFSESPVVICCDNREGNSMLQIVAKKGDSSDLVVIIALDGYSKKLYDIAKISKEIGMCVFGLLNGTSSLLHSAIDQILSLEVEDMSIFYEIAFETS